MNISMATKVKLSYTGIGQLLRGEEMKNLMTQFGSDRAHRAGDGYNFRVHNTGQRQVVNIFPETYEAYKDNLQNNTLLKIL